jgi:hypothetical protein
VEARLFRRCVNRPAIPVPRHLSHEFPHLLSHRQLVGALRVHPTEQVEGFLPELERVGLRLAGSIGRSLSIRR